MTLEEKVDYLLEQVAIIRRDIDMLNGHAHGVVVTNDPPQQLFKQCPICGILYNTFHTHHCSIEGVVNVSDYPHSFDI